MSCGEARKAGQSFLGQIKRLNCDALHCPGRLYPKQEIVVLQLVIMLRMFLSEVKFPFSVKINTSLGGGPGIAAVELWISVLMPHLTQQDIRRQLLVVEQADCEGVAERHIREGQHLVPDGGHVAALRLGAQAGHARLRIHRHLHVAVNGVEALQQVIGGRDVLALYHLHMPQQISLDSPCWECKTKLTSDSPFNAQRL